jgi:enterochelin esterase-like enzyme/outer membrane protein assembly factor BamB
MEAPMDCRTRPGRVLLLALVALIVSAPAFAAEWASWLGPTRDGRVTGVGLGSERGVGFELAWKRSLGLGYTGIALADGRALTMFGDGKKDFVVALDPKTGEERWRYEIGDMFPARGGSEGGPNSFPVVADGVVYGLSAAGQLFALQAKDGKELWKLRIDESLGGRPAMFGFSTVPLVAGDVLFVQVGGDKGNSLVGFDRKTGKVLWNTGDDKTGYGSPILATLAGVEQIVAQTNVAVYGLEPKTGKVLWKREDGMVGGNDTVATPVLIGDDRFFIHGDPESKAFAVKREGDGFKVEEAWATKSLKGSLANPVFHEGYLYGFDGDFLACISAKDGSKAWKSRPPGGRGLILVDRQLLIFANDGSIVAVEATPKSYHETGRLELTDAGTYTYPSFADGVLFVRNTKDIAAVATKAVDAPIAVAAAAPAPRNSFERFIATVQSSDSKAKLVDDYMKGQTTFPVVEKGWVHFVYRGKAEDVAMTGSMTDYQIEEPLAHVEGTDLFYRSYPVSGPTRWEYRYNVDFENPQPDPMNPNKIPGREGDLSEVMTEGFAASPWLEKYNGAKAGRIESLTHKSEILGNERKIEVYLPPGYDGGSQRYPLVVAIDGQGWHEFGRMSNVLDHLASGGAVPMIVAFVYQPQDARGEMGPKVDDWARMIADEAVPKLDSSYRTLAKAEARAILGGGGGGAVAVYVALQRPEVFGKAAAASVYLGTPAGQKLMTTVDSFAGASKPAVAVTWNKTEMHRAEWNLDVAKDTERLVQALKDKGFDVKARQAEDTSGWGAWPVRAGEMLVTLFPAS